MSNKLDKQYQDLLQNYQTKNYEIRRFFICRFTTTKARQSN